MWLWPVHVRKAKVCANLISKELLFISVLTNKCLLVSTALGKKLPSTPHMHPLQSVKRLCCVLPVEGEKREPADGVHIQGQDLKLPTVVDIVG